MCNKFPAVICAAFLVAVADVPAEAQLHDHGSRIAAIPLSPLLFGGFYYPQPYPVFGFPAPFLFPGDPTVTLRFLVTPRDASVFVDGYAAGVVDDFDGVFQRLRVIPGHHEIVVYHPGYRAFRQSLYFNPGSTHTIRHTMDPLAPGESPEPQPVPRSFPPPPNVPLSTALPGGATRMGMLALRVQPSDASVLIDGSEWPGPQPQGRMAIQLADGPHRLRIEKSGFQAFTVDVEIRAGETTTLNISLAP